MIGSTVMLGQTMLAQTPEPAEMLQELPFEQKVVAITLAVIMLAVVGELIRRRKLREEYAFLWIGTGLLLFVLALEPSLLGMFQRGIGAAIPSSALFFGALVFLMLFALQFSVRLTKLTTRNKALVQKLALLQDEVEELRQRIGRPKQDAVPVSEPPEEKVREGGAA